MREYLDGMLAYTFSVWALFYSSVLYYSHDIVSIGGLVVLAFRLYVDGGRALKKWRGK
ncbi:hypothetical protein HOS22_gp53 [Rhizobium phage RHEph08]|uniref:Transmembrane protein n=2 Tax=Cuernavacavirus TaxID=2731935 RepID=L7TN53_9CAUD|nr:hypothetical protein HOS22_gp53 [Rhizobium phage RHEph08]YP_009793290.1 hypothetical protein HOS23_gp48 [Rhizobium phage RHEph09]AGC35977.1 hypothetical protein RHEph08_gp053 [Rhizobium phage RHEph08]AGC36031.1 hypothetical protein RHEph09_gp048 [Rhizobium phage RHEph09]